MTVETQYSQDVESMQIRENVPTWTRERTHEELSNFVERHLAIVGELDPAEYEVANA